MKSKRKAGKNGVKPSLWSEPLESRLLLTTLPPGFFETQLAEGLSNVTAMTLAPDGRIFVSEQAGAIRVIKDGQLLPTPFATVQTDFNLEMGLHSVAFDPNFATNHYVYVFYTALSDDRNRVARLTADGDTAVPGSETLIMEFNPLYTGTYHMGGDMKFLPDGTLLISHGDDANYLHAQDLTTFDGKMIRINPDGSIPTDNPFYNVAEGDYRAIWAVGLRNPYTFDIQPGTNRILIDDVGENSWEEINPGIAGANYGWATTEGTFDQQTYPDLTEPIYTYPHTANGAAITGGAFYNPDDPMFGSQYVGSYFFCDFVSGWIKRADLSGPTPQVTDFATGINGPTFTTVGPDGSLYYLEYGTGSVWRIQKSDTVAPTVAQWSFGWDDPVNPQSIAIQFSEDVSGIDSADDISLVDAATLQAIHPASFTYDQQSHRAVFTMPGHLPDGNYTVTIHAGAVEDAAGNPLAADDSYDFFVLAGDANRDRVVDGSDIYIFSQNWLSSGTFSQGDFNYDGTVDARDLGLLALNWQQHLDPQPRLTAVNWDGGGDGTSWNDPLNWSNDQLPTSTSVVTIASGEQVELSGTDVEIASLHSSVPLIINQQILTVDGDVALDADMQLYRAQLVLGGNLTLNATLNLGNGIDNSGGNIKFNGTGNRSINGTGTISANPSDNACYVDNATHDPGGNYGQQLTIGSGIQITGLDFVMRTIYSNGSIVNYGTLTALGGGYWNLGLNETSFTDADSTFYNYGTISGQPGLIFLWFVNLQNMPGGVINVDQTELDLYGHWHNNGTITATDSNVDLGGTFVFGDIGTLNRTGGAVNLIGTLDNTGQTLTLDDTTGSWNLAGTILGGTYEATDDNELFATGGTLDGVTVNSPMWVAGGVLHVLHGLTLNSTLYLDAGISGSHGEVYFDGAEDQTIDGDGAIVSQSSDATDYILNNTYDPDADAGKNLTIGSGILITNSGPNVNIQQFHAGATITNDGAIIAHNYWNIGSGAGAFINNGSIDSHTWMEITSLQNGAAGTVFSTDAYLLLDGTWQNGGSITASNGGLDLGGSFTTADAMSIMYIDSTVNIVGTMDNTASTLTLSNATGSWNLAAGGSIISGTYDASDGKQLFAAGGLLDGVVANAPISVLGTDLFITDGLTLNSTLTLDTDGQGSDGGRISFVGEQDQTLDGSGAIVSQTNPASSHIYNATYNFVEDSGKQLTLGSGIEIMGLGLDIQSSNPGGAIVNDGQFNLTGSWQVGGSFVNDGVINLGQNNILTVSGDFSQSATGSIVTTLAGTTPGTDFGQIVVSGSATIAGTLSVTLAPSYDPDETATFPIVVGAPLTGTFTTFTGGPTPSGRTLFLSYDAAQAIVDVAPLPAPSLPLMAVQPTGPAPQQTVYLSNLTPTSVTNGYGQYEKDRSNGEAGAHDGHTITLNGKTYDKGLGVHAGSTQIYNLNGQYTQFLADIGVDDEVGSKGSVVFQAYLDNVKVYDSKTMTGNSVTQSTKLDVTGKKQLKLVVTDAGNGRNYDHADWAGARLLTSQGAASTPLMAAPPSVPISTPAKKTANLISTIPI